MDLLNDQPWVLAGAIFAARVTDVSFGTLRTIMVFRGYRVYAALLGFCEVLLWIMAAGSVIQNLERWYLAVAYAGGFATGNIVGMWIEARLAMGYELVRAISDNRDVDLAERLRGHRYSVVAMPGFAENELPVEVVLVTERRRNVPRLMQRIYELDPDAVCTVTDVKGRPYRSAPRMAGPIAADWWRITKKK